MNGDHVYAFFIMCPGIFLAKYVILSPSSSVLLMVSTACANKHSVSNLHHYIHRGMVHHTNLIWSDHYLCSYIVHGMVNCTSLIRNISTWIEHFHVTKHLYGSICKFIIFVHALPYQTTVVYCYSIVRAQITTPSSTLEWGLFRLAPTILTGIKSEHPVPTTLVTIKEHNIKLMVHVFLTAISHGHTHN